MTTIISQCYWCKRYKGNAHCAAFGDTRIPNDVFFNVRDHKEPYEGDNGIQFEPKEDGRVPTLSSPEESWPSFEERF